MKENPFEDIAAKSDIDIADMWKTLLGKTEFKKKINQVTYLTTGITETRLSDQLSDIIESNKSKFKISFLPSYFGVKVRVCSAFNNETKEDFNNIIHNLPENSYKEYLKSLII